MKALLRFDTEDPVQNAQYEASKNAIKYKQVLENITSWLLCNAHSTLKPAAIAEQLKVFARQKSLSDLIVFIDRHEEVCKQGEVVNW